MCKHYKWVCDVKILAFLIERRMTSEVACGILNVQYVTGICHPHSILYDYGRVGWDVRGGLGVSTRGKSMLKPLLPTRLPPR